MFNLGKITGQHLNMSISKLIQSALDTEASQVLYSLSAKLNHGSKYWVVSDQMSVVAVKYVFQCLGICNNSWEAFFWGDDLDGKVVFL